jgi:hypothetical protein
MGIKQEKYHHHHTDNEIVSNALLSPKEMVTDYFMPWNCQISKYVFSLKICFTLFQTVGPTNRIKQYKYVYFRVVSPTPRKT